MGGSPRLGLPDLPTDAWTPIIENVRKALGLPDLTGVLGEWGGLKPSVWSVPGPLESGVFDRPDPILSDVLSGPGGGEGEYQIPTPIDQPEFLPGWPEEWIKGEGGWNEDEWVTEEEAEMAIDWGSVVSGAIDIAQGQVAGPRLPPLSLAAPMAGGGSFSYPAGQKVTVDTATGKVTLCRRRRRRRLLTPTDLNDLAALKTIVGGGQAINFAVMKAVRR